MSNKYKSIGTLGNTVKVRTQKNWVIVLSNGEEVKFSNKNLLCLL